MSPALKRELLLSMRETYAEAAPRLRKQILGNFVAATGYTRKYAITLLAGASIKPKNKRIRAALYDDEVQSALVQVWQYAGYICSKRLIPFLPDFIPCLERFGHIKVSDSVREKLLKISASTADRVLKTERRRLGRGLSTTRAGNLLRHQIPIRTFADWNNERPGFFEADLVAHNGGMIRGACVHTLTLTDIASGWTECLALLNKGEDEVLHALSKVARVLPMHLEGIDTDNGTEFINHGLVAFCESEGITFTRSREYKKNDQAHVEEKNGSVVRRLVGFQRFEGEPTRRTLEALYRVSRLYVNYFQPSLKLIDKNRSAGRVTKRYDSAKTPCHRLLLSDIPQTDKDRLRRTFHTLDPVALLSRIELLQLELIGLLEVVPELELGQTVTSVIFAPDIERLQEPALVAIKETKRPRKRYLRRIPLAAQRKKGAPHIVPQNIVEQIHQLLTKDPSLTGIPMIKLINSVYPGSFNKTHKGTFDRIIRTWRTAHPEYFDLYPVRYKYVNKQNKKGSILNEATGL